jgi:methyltransferase
VKGPYRWIAHPNYIAVALELTGVALALRARVTGPLAVALFSLLMFRRVQVEEKALAGR